MLSRLPVMKKFISLSAPFSTKKIEIFINGKSYQVAISSNLRSITTSPSSKLPNKMESKSHASATTKDSKLQAIAGCVSSKWKRPPNPLLPAALKLHLP